MSRRPIIAGNWKLNCTVGEALELASAVRDKCSRFRDIDVVVGPTHLAVYSVAQRLKDTPIRVAAQNCHWAPKGAFTGEMSPAHLADAGVAWCIIGHSERRQFFGETDEGVAKKARALHDHGVLPIICVGESLEQRDAGLTIGWVTGQVKAALAELTPDEAAVSVIAYEPIWAIGTGRTATPEQAQEVHAAIRATLTDLYGPAISARIRLQYGGSVKASNVKALMGQEDIDGALVGGASLTADSFMRIVAHREDD